MDDDVYETKAQKLLINAEKESQQGLEF